MTEGHRKQKEIMLFPFPEIDKTHLTLQKKSKEDKGILTEIQYALYIFLALH